MNRLDESEADALAHSIATSIVAAISPKRKRAAVSERVTHANDTLTDGRFAVERTEPRNPIPPYSPFAFDSSGPITRVRLPPSTVQPEATSSRRIARPGHPPPFVQPEATTSDRFERVVGSNDLLPVEFLFRGWISAAAVCRIRVAEGYGTGFLVAEDIVMTNNHVIPKFEDATTAVFEFDYRADFRGGLQISFADVNGKDSFVSSDTLDYTLVKLATPPGFPHVRLSSTSRVSQETPRRFVIIQHPNGGFKQVALHSSEEVGGSPNPAFVLYTTDTAPGSSGSPVFDVDWNAIALHHAAGQQDSTGKWLSNEGVLIRYILEDVGQKNPSVRRRIGASAEISFHGDVSKTWDGRGGSSTTVSAGFSMDF